VDGDDVNVVSSLVVAQGHVQGFAGLDLCHHQTLRKGLGPSMLLNDLSFLDDPQSLLSADASLVGPPQRVVAPLDALGSGGCSDLAEVEGHKNGDA